MTVTLVFLGKLEDVAGAASRAVAHASTLDALIDGLSPELAAALRAPRIRCAVNGVLVRENQAPQIAEGDEIAFLPPVSGG